MDDVEHIINSRLDVVQVYFLRSEGVIHVLLVRRAAERGYAVQLSDPEQCLRRRTCPRRDNRPDGGMAEKGR